MVEFFITEENIDSDVGTAILNTAVRLVQDSKFLSNLGEYECISHCEMYGFPISYFTIAYQIAKENAPIGAFEIRDMMVKDILDKKIAISYLSMSDQIHAFWKLETDIKKGCFSESSKELIKNLVDGSRNFHGETHKERLKEMKTYYDLRKEFYGPRVESSVFAQAFERYVKEILG